MIDNEFCDVLRTVFPANAYAFIVYCQPFCNMATNCISIYNFRHLGETLDDIQAEAFAVVREAARRTLGMRHFDVQVAPKPIINV